MTPEPLPPELVPLIPGTRIAEGRLVKVLDALFAVIIVDAQEEHGTISYVNKLAAHLTGWKVEELLGQPLDVLVPEPSRAAHRHYRLGFVHRPMARPMGPDREVVLLHKSGREIDVWIGLAPIDDNRVTAVILPMDIGRRYGIGTDVRFE